MNQNNAIGDGMDHPLIADFRTALERAGMSNEAAQEHTKKLAEISALAVLDRTIPQEHREIRKEEELKTILAAYPKDELQKLIEEEVRTQLQRYFLSIKSSLTVKAQKEFASILGIKS